MSKPHGVRAKPVGLAPGTLVHMGKKRTDQVRIRIFDYTEGAYEEKQIDDIADCFEYLDRDSVTWVNIDGLHLVEVIGKIGDHLGLHPLVMEDILHTHQRPKLEDHEGYLYVVARMLSYAPEQNGVQAEQLSMVLGKKAVITFQERPGDFFEPVRERIRLGKGRLRKLGADYLCYALLDAVVDHYFKVLEALGDEIEELETELMEEATEEHANQIHQLKREMLTLRKSLWPLREVVNNLERNESGLISKATRTFLRDVHDHTVQVIDTVETFRDMVTGLLDLYISSVSNRMNEVMKVLTMIATIFIPLTFVAGIYGMNFSNMPELGWRYGYFVVIGVMAVLATVMVVLFRRKGWF